MNVPKLRFKEFSGEWKENKLHDIAKITMGQSPHSENYTNDSNDTLLIQGNADLCNGKVIPRLFTKQITKTCDKEDIIMTVRAPVGDIAISDYYACIGRGVCSIKSSKFIYHYLDYLKEKGYWKKISKGSTIDSITSDNIKSLVIKTPSKKEQEKIIKIIDLINKKIELQIKKIEALKLFKEALKLFKSCTINEIFKNGNHVCKLGAILNKWNKKNKDGAINYVESISNKAGFIPQSEQFEDRNVASKNLRNYYVIKKGVFGYNPSRLNVGSLALKKNDSISVVSPLYECFTTTQNNAYLLEWFNSNYFKKETFSRFEGGVRNTLNFNNLCDIPINLPDIETQNKYAEYFNKINFKITLEEQKLSKLVKLKKGMLQDMFI